MKIGILLETNEPEQAWNGVRFANPAFKQRHEVKRFLMDVRVEAVGITHERYNVQRQLHDFGDAKGVLLACGTCIKSRNQNGSDVCPISPMNDCLAMVAWADNVVTC